jgi:hypothetical protein
MYVKALLILRSLEFVCNAYKNTVPASQRTQSVFITNTNELILFREVIANNYENYKKYIYTEFVNGTLDLKLLPRYSGQNGKKKVNTHP